VEAVEARNMNISKKYAEARNKNIDISQKYGGLSYDSLPTFEMPTEIPMFADTNGARVSPSYHNNRRPKNFINRPPGDIRSKKALPSKSKLNVNASEFKFDQKNHEPETQEFKKQMPNNERVPAKMNANSKEFSPKSSLSLDSKEFTPRARKKEPTYEELVQIERERRMRADFEKMVAEYEYEAMIRYQIENEFESMLLHGNRDPYANFKPRQGSRMRSHGGPRGRYQKRGTPRGGRRGNPRRNVDTRGYNRRVRI